MTLMMVLSMFSGLTFSAYADTASTAWDGSADTSWYSDSASEFSLSDSADLAGFAKLVNEGNTFEGKTVTLTDDVYLNSDADPEVNVWTPVAQVVNGMTNGMPEPKDESEQHPFKGTFDGNGHYVYNMYINNSLATSEFGVGNALFGYNMGTVKNVGVTGSTSSFRTDAGIAGINKGSISGCYSYVTVSGNGRGSNRGSGGIVGTNYGSVQDCINRGSVTDNGNAGGIVGFNDGGSITSCYNVGNVSASTCGGITSTNEKVYGSSEGTVSNCYYLTGSCAAGVYKTDDSAATASAFGTDGKLVSDSSKSLIDALNAQSSVKYIAPVSGVYPVLSWQKDFVWDGCSVKVVKPEGADFSVKYNDGATDKEITSLEKVKPGTVLTLTADNIAEGSLFGGFTAKDNSTGKSENIGGIAKNAPYTASYTVQGDVEISASVVSKSDTALTVYRQMGDAGKKVKIKDISWNDLMADADANASKYGYMYYKGGWTVLGGDGLTTLDSILKRAGVTPADTDQIVASDPTGYEAAASYSILKASQDQYKFYPQAGGNLDSDEGALVVPAGIAYSWNTVSLSGEAKAEDALASAVATSYINPTGMRFVYGTNEADFNAKSGTSAAGKRLAKGVTEIIIRTAVSSDSFPGAADITAAALSDGTDRAPYDSYTASYDAATGTVNVAASGLNSYVNAAAPADGSGYWAGLSIPVGSASADQIKIGTNFSDLATVNASLVADGRVSFYWDTFKNDLTNILISTDGGQTVYNIPVKCAISQSVFNFAGIELSMDQLKKYETTAEFKCIKKGSEYTYTVTGIKVSDILKNYAPDVKAAAVKFTEVGDGFSGTAANYQYSWDDAMIIWKKVNASGEEETLKGTGLSSAVNGSGGNLWVTNLGSASYTAADLSLDGRYVTKAQLAGNDDENVTTETFMMNGNERTVKGVKISKLLEKGIIRDTPAAVTFASGSYVQTAAQCDYGLDNIMITWDDSDATASLSAAVNGSGGKLWVSKLDTVTIEKSVFEVSVDGASKYLSMDQLKAHETSKDMSMQTKAGTSTYKVTGITMSDMISNYLGKGAYTDTLASVNYYEQGGEATPTQSVYNREHSWDDVMVIWSQKDDQGNEKIESGLREAVDGANGKFWWSGIVGMNAVRADFTIDGVGFAISEIDQDAVTSAEFIMIKKGTESPQAVTGITVKALAEKYLNGSVPAKMTAAAADGYSQTVSIGTGENEYAADKVMLAWQSGTGDDAKAESPIRIAVDGGAGNLWTSGVCTVSNSYSVSFNKDPEDLTVTVRDDQDAEVAAESDGTFILKGGSNYSYKAERSGYTPKSGDINIILGAGTVIDVVLNKSSSGGGSGGSSGGNTGTTDPADKPGAILTIYTQEGKDGAKKAVASFTKDELFGLSTTNRSGYVYQYYRNQIWSAVVATRVVKFDDLLSDAGVSFTSKDSMRQDASSDGFNTTLTYKQINENRYFFDPADNGKMSEVPAGIALEWEQGDIEDGYADVAAKAFYSGSLRYVVGTTESLYKGTGGLSNDREYAPGYRLGSNIDSITIIKNAEVSDTSGRVTGGGTNASTPETKPEDKDIADVKTTTDSKTGAVTEVTTYKDGSVKTVVTEKNGDVTTTVDVTAIAQEAVKNGKTLTLPLTGTKASDDQTEASLIIVKTGSKSNVKVEIPVSGMNEGVVAVAVGKDGAEKTIINAVSSANGIVVSVADGDQIKLVNKAGKFSDVASGNWAEGPVAFVTSRDIFNGTGNGKFSPSAPMTRAMLMTVLARIDGADTTAPASGNWYDKGLAWAVEKKVSDGSVPMSSISREQLVTMLYRYAGQPAVTDGSLSSFSDASSVSDYAKTAMTWAVKNGIINGMDGKIAPKSNATRAQVAAMIQRYIKATA